jgi:hypothetical protein
MQPIIAVLLCCAAVAACASREEKVKARFVEWTEQCGYPPGTLIPDEEYEATKACVLALEQGYQDDRAQDQASGAALLGFGAAMSAQPYSGRSRSLCASTYKRDSQGRGYFENTYC